METKINFLSRLRERKILIVYPIVTSFLVWVIFFILDEINYGLDWGLGDLFSSLNYIFPIIGWFVSLRVTEKRFVITRPDFNEGKKINYWLILVSVAIGIAIFFVTLPIQQFIIPTSSHAVTNDWDILQAIVFIMLFSTLIPIIFSKAKILKHAYLTFLFYFLSAILVVIFYLYLMMNQY